MTDYNDNSDINSSGEPAPDNSWMRGLGLTSDPTDAITPPSSPPASPLGVSEAQNVYNRVFQTGAMLTGMRMGAAMAAGQPPESFWSQNNGQLSLGVPDPIAHPYDQRMNPLFHQALAPLHNNTLDAVEQYQQLQQTNPDGNFDQAEQIMSDARASAQNHAHLYGAWDPTTFYALGQPKAQSYPQNTPNGNLSNTQSPQAYTLNTYHFYNPHPVYTIRDPDTDELVQFEYAPDDSSLGNRVNVLFGNGKYYVQRGSEYKANDYSVNQQRQVTPDQARQILQNLNSAQTNPGTYNFILNNSIQAPERDIISPVLSPPPTTVY